ncbi:MAG: hypothetical protein M5U01_42115 [Ardenticatenaceae bacterium]|nr:hypothetical protein [Ardenticatenaceae bacterium]HBY99093.1 hypothetical protein [Chloroflexota bacterium]
MMRWVIFALFTVVALATADFCVKLAAGKLSNSIALLLYGSCSFFIGLIWVLWERTQSGTLFLQPAGLAAGIGVGLAFTGVTIGLYLTFGAGAPVSVASPVIRLGGLLLVSVAGLAILHEPFSWRYLLGVMLAVSGLVLILTR